MKEYVVYKNVNCERVYLKSINLDVMRKIEVYCQTLDKDKAMVMPESLINNLKYMKRLKERFGYDGIEEI